MGAGSLAPIASAQPVVEVETESGSELLLEELATPQTLPGRTKGARTRPAPEATAEENLEAPPHRLLQRGRITGDWFNARAWLESKGVTIEIGAIHDFSSTLSGGARHRLNSQTLFDANVSFDLDKLVSWKGATFFVDVQSHTGREAARDSGDIQVFTNIDAPNFFELYELWIEQYLFDKHVRIKIGKIDANSEFAFVDNGGEFINSSMGFSPTIFVLPTFPDPSFSANLFVYPNDWLYAGVGVYDGSTALGIATGPRGLRTFFAGSADELFIIGEIGATYALKDGTLPGRIGVGGWGHTANFTRFDGGIEDGSSGFYLVADQMLWRENPDDPDDNQGIGAFFQYGWADPDVSEINHHIGAGAIWAGLIPGRDDDIVGFGITAAIITDKPSAGFSENAETTMEWFYKATLTSAISIKPDLQYILNPSGDAALDNALVGTLRLEFVF